MLSFDKMEMRHSKKEKKCGFLWQPSIFIKKMENCKYVNQIATHTLDWFWLEIACNRSRQVKYRDILCQATFKEVTFQKGTSWPTCWMQKSESLPTPDMVREASTNERTGDKRYLYPLNTSKSTTTLENKTGSACYKRYYSFRPNLLQSTQPLLSSHQGLFLRVY